MKLSPRKTPFRMDLGDRGEVIAWNYLAKKGYKILEKNYRCPLGEVDIITEKNKRVIFVEVKTRTSSRFGAPEEAVSPIKQKKIARLAEWYLKGQGWIDRRALSFDVLAIDWQDPSKPKVRHLENAFYLGSDYV